MKASPAEIAAQLERHERALLDPVVRRNSAGVGALLTGDFEEIGASGRVWTRDGVLKLLADETYFPPAMENFRCRVVAAGVALVTYTTVRTDPETGACVAAHRSSLWIEVAGEWRMRFHQGTPAARSSLAPPAAASEP